MSRLNRLALVAVIAALALVLVIPAGAQGGGGIIVVSTFGSGPVNFNPVTSSTATEQDVMSLLYPALVGVDPEEGVIKPNVPGGVAESWEISEDGLTYTFKLREGFSWSDGVPLTARDFEFTWDAIASGETESPLVFLTDSIVDMVATDDYTLEVTFTQATCEAVFDAGIQPLPAHIFEGQPFSAVNDNLFNTPDSVAVGPYRLASQIADQQTALVPATHPNPDGLPLNDGWVQRIYGSQTVELEAFLAGETSSLAFIPPDRRAEVIAAAEAGRLDYFTYSPGNAWDYMNFNLADPNNPMGAYDEDGNLVEQPPHPIFADVRVRQALNMAVDVDAIVQGAVFGFGSRMNGPYAPGSWVYTDTVPNYQYDPEAALAMLADAGWIDDDNDPSTPLVAQGALNAPDGTPFQFTLFTNQGNTRREAIGTIIQDQLGQLGIRVDFQTIDFNVLVELLDQQTFDAVILGWRNGYPFRPDLAQIFGSVGDQIGGSNSVSYVNPELDELFRRGVSTLETNDCDIETRRAIYAEVTEILHRDAPYLWLYSIDGMYAWNTNVQGVNPYPNTLYWNVSQWTVQQ